MGMLLLDDDLELIILRPPAAWVEDLSPDVGGAGVGGFLDLAVVVVLPLSSESVEFDEELEEDEVELVELLVVDVPELESSSSSSSSLLEHDDEDSDRFVGHSRAGCS